MCARGSLCVACPWCAARRCVGHVKRPGPSCLSAAGQRNTKKKPYKQRQRGKGTTLRRVASLSAVGALVHSRIATGASSHPVLQTLNGTRTGTSAAASPHAGAPSSLPPLRVVVSHWLCGASSSPFIPAAPLSCFPSSLPHSNTSSRHRCPQRASCLPTLPFFRSSAAAFVYGWTLGQRCLLQTGTLSRHSITPTVRESETEAAADGRGSRPRWPSPHRGGPTHTLSRSSSPLLAHEAG